MTPHFYSLGGWGVLASDIEFPELSSAVEKDPDFIFKIDDVTPPLALPVKEIQRWELADDTEWLVASQAGSDYLLRFPAYADFAISDQFQTITCSPRQEVQLSTLRHLFLDQVMPLVMAAKGETVLHGSAVVMHAGAVAFLGPSGAGKSTVAVKLAAAGYPLITDDCLLLRYDNVGPLAYPSYAGARMFSGMAEAILGQAPLLSDVAEYTAKRRVSSEQIPVQESPVPLQHLFLLTDGTRLSSRPVRGSELFVNLARYKYRLNPSDEALLRSEFSLLQELTKIPCHELVYPKDEQALSEIENVVLSRLVSTQ